MQRHVSVSLYQQWSCSVLVSAELRGFPNATIASKVLQDKVLAAVHDIVCGSSEDCQVDARVPAGQQAQRRRTDERMQSLIEVEMTVLRKFISHLQERVDSAALARQVSRGNDTAWMTSDSLQVSVGAPHASQLLADLIATFYPSEAGSTSANLVHEDHVMRLAALPDLLEVSLGIERDTIEIVESTLMMQRVPSSPSAQLPASESPFNMEFDDDGNDNLITILAASAGVGGIVLIIVYVFLVKRLRKNVFKRTTMSAASAASGGQVKTREDSTSVERSEAQGAGAMVAAAAICADESMTGARRAEMVRTQNGMRTETPLSSHRPSSQHTPPPPLRLCSSGDLKAVVSRASQVASGYHSHAMKLSTTGNGARRTHSNRTLDDNCSSCSQQGATYVQKSNRSGSAEAPARLSRRSQSGECSAKSATAPSLSNSHESSTRRNGEMKSCRQLDWASSTDSATPRPDQQSAHTSEPELPSPKHVQCARSDACSNKAALRVMVRI